MQIDPYCQRQKCSPVNVLSSDVRVMQIFTGVRETWGVKQESGRSRCRFLADRTIGRAFGTVCRLSVCLSVCLSSVTFCIVAKWYVLAKNCLKE